MEFIEVTSDLNEKVLININTIVYIAPEFIADDETHIKISLSNGKTVHTKENYSFFKNRINHTS